MADINIAIGTGGVLKLTYPNKFNGWARYSKNNTTDKYVAQATLTGKVHTNLLCDVGSDMEYVYTRFGSIDSVPITSNDVLFVELEKLLQ